MQRQSSNHDYLKTNDNDELLVDTGSTITQTGDTRVSTTYPVCAVNFVNGISPSKCTTFTASGGSLSADNAVLSTNISTTVGSYALLRTKRVCTYRSGFVSVCRFTMKCDSNAVSNSLQMGGFGNSNSDIYIGMSGTDFVCRYSTGGNLHAVQLTITNPASGAETATITLNGTPYTVALTNAGGASSFTAHNLEYGNYGGLWSVQHINNTVIFYGTSVGARSGTYSFSSTGTATGTFTTLKTGSTLSTTVVKQRDWNGDSWCKTIDPFKMQLYEISYIWLGVGNIIFRIFDPDENKFRIAHTFRFANSNSLTQISSPNMYGQLLTASVGSSTALSTQFRSVFLGGFATSNVDFIKLGSRFSINASETLTANTEKVILYLERRDILANVPVQSEVFLRSISLTADGTKPVRFSIYTNATVGSNTTSDYTNATYIDSNDSVMLYDTTATTFSGGRRVFDVLIGKTDSRTIDVELFDIYLGLNDNLVITGLSTAGSDVSISVSWIEDV